jgi:hypothetical protein
MKPVTYAIVVLYLFVFSVSAEHHHEDHDFEFTQHHSHEHDKVVAAISYSQDQLNLHIKLPAFNAFGFEHSPKNKQQQELVDSTIEKLSQSINIIELLPNCVPILVNSTDSHINTSTTVDEHFDVELDYEFKCPPNEAISVSFSLFRTTPSIKQIDVQFISDKEQKLFTLNSENNTITID